MAYNVPTNPFLQGTVLNTDRFTNYYLQQQAHKQAKEEAFNKYNEDLGKNLTPAGMRAQDVEGLTNLSKQWQEFGIKNRAAINNPSVDGGAARNKFYGAYQELQGGIAKSKAQAEQDKLFAATKNNPDIFNRIEPETIQKKAKSDLPIWHPDYKPFNTSTDLAYGAAPFDLKKQEELDKIALSNIPLSKNRKTIGISKRDPLQDDVEITTTISPENKLAAAKTYADAYNFDKSVKRGIDDIAVRIAPRTNMAGQLEIPKELENYSNLYTSVFPDDHFLNNDGTVDKEKLAFAYGLSRLPSDKKEVVEEKNDTRAMAAQAAKQKEVARFSNSLGIARDRINAAMKDDGQSQYIEQRMRQLEEDPNGITQVIVDKSNKPIEAGKSIPLSPVDSKAFSYKVGKEDITPDAVFVPSGKEGAYKVIVYKRTPIVKVKDEATGNISETGGEIVKIAGKPMVDNSLTRTFTRQQAKEALAGTMFSGKIEKMELGQPKVTPKNAPTSKFKGLPKTGKF